MESYYEFFNKRLDGQIDELENFGVITSKFHVIFIRPDPFKIDLLPLFFYTLLSAERDIKYFVKNSDRLLRNSAQKIR